MVRILSVALFFMLCFSFPAFAHHPTEEMLDEELYAMIDEMVSDVHAEMVFDENGVGMIEDITVEDADDLIKDGLLDAAAALDGDVTVTIEILETETRETQPQLLSIEELSNGYGTKVNQDKYQNLWDHPVRIRFLQLK